MTLYDAIAELPLTVEDYTLEARAQDQPSGERAAAAGQGDAQGGPRGREGEARARAEHRAGRAAPPELGHDAVRADIVGERQEGEARGARREGKRAVLPDGAEIGGMDRPVHVGEAAAE